MKTNDEEMEKYIDKNWNEKEEYNDDLKQLIWEAVAKGVKDYLKEYEEEAVKIIAKEFLEHFSNKDISINIR